MMDGKYTDDQVGPKQVAPSESPPPDNMPVDSSEDPYEAASRASVDYSQFTPQLKPRRTWPRIAGWTFLTIVILGGLGAGGWWYISRKPAPKPTQHNQRQTQQQSSTVAATTKHYDSSDLSLGFDYPDNWTVSDNGNGKLTVTSPAMQLTGADGQSQTGQVVMSIQSANAADFSMFQKGSAAAVLPSKKIAYTKPTSTQRADTYISFLQYAATTTHGALDGIYVTGDYGYQYAQPILESDITKVDPDIRVTFVKCANVACTGTSVPFSISSTMWGNSSFSTPIEDMLKSLAIQ